MKKDLQNKVVGKLLSNISTGKKKRHDNCIPQ